MNVKKISESKDKSITIPPSLYTHAVHPIKRWESISLLSECGMPCNLHQPNKNVAEMVIKEAILLHRSGLACCDRGLKESPRGREDTR